MAETNKWLSDTYQYIVNNMESSYAPRFLAATGPTMIYNGTHLDDASNNAVNNLTYKGSALEEFIKEMQ